MKSSNPVLTRGFAQMDPARLGVNPTETDSLEATYSAPAASALRTGRMTIDDVVIKTAMLFVVLVAVGAFAWRANLGGGALLVGLFGGFALAMVNTFSKKVRPALIISYAGLQGLALGTLSNMYNTIYPGIVSQAVIGTVCAFAGMLFAYRSGRIRVTPKFTRVITGALLGYFLLALVSMFAGFAGVSGGAGLYGVSGLGLLLALGGVALASFFLVLDFDQIQKSINAGVAQEESWRAAFGLMVTLVWLYLEILRLISILRGNN